MVTKAQVERLVRQKCGPKSGVRFNPNAPTEKDKAPRRERIREINARIKEIEIELTTINSRHWHELLAAAKFVCDVDGDCPSIDELRKAVNLSSQFAELVEEKQSL